VNGEPAGFVVVSALADDATATGWLDAIAVAPPHQRRGLGFGFTPHRQYAILIKDLASPSNS